VENDLRDCRPADAAAIAEIYNEAVHAGNATMDDRTKSEQDMLDLISSFTERETILVLEESSRVVGWGIIKRYSDRPGYRFACETSVYLRDSHTRRGLGTAIKRAIIERCRSYRYHHLVAKIFADNRGSVEYNLRLGYELVGIQREVGYKNGGWQDIAILQLVLDDSRPVETTKATPGKNPS